MFLHYLATRSPSEMLYKFFAVQWKYPTRGDWTETVKKDLVDLQIDLTLEQIKGLKKERFAEIVKGQVKKVAFAEMMAKKETLSKLNGLSYNELKIQD